MTNPTAGEPEARGPRLDELEQRVARLMEQWVERSVWDLERLGTGELPVAAERAQEASHVFEMLDRALTAVERARAAPDP